MASKSGRSVGALQAIAREANADLAGAAPDDVIEWAAGRFADSVFATQSMANTALATMIADCAAQVPVYFIDTGLHFPETLATRDDVARAHAALRLITIHSPVSIDEQARDLGSSLWMTDPDQCCEIRKVSPMRRLWATHDAWITGLRRADRHDGAPVDMIEVDEARGIVKICPLLEWSDADLLEYATQHGTIVNPLLAEGFNSIGCRPCTRRTAEGEHPRSGRWPGFDKTECGLHRRRAG